MIARWLSGFSGADRVEAATRLVGSLEWSRNNPHARSVSRESAAELAAAITATPDLPADVLERSRAVLPQPSTP